ncbi:substrate-binding domain-containing protein [Streptomyces sp. NPDC002346]
MGGRNAVALTARSVSRAAAPGAPDRAVPADGRRREYGHRYRFGRHGTSAVIAYNDQLAIGLMRGLQAAGRRVPQDVSVVGFDNIFGAELVTPGLTTVAAPLRAQGYTAVRDLLSVLGGAHASTGRPMVLPTRLVVRGSTAPRGRGQARSAAPDGPAPGPR